MYVYYNALKFQADGYGDSTFVRHSELAEIRTANALNSSALYTEFFANENELIDEVDFLQLGQVDQTNFHTISYGKSEQSTWKNWPTPENRSRYKFNSVLLSLGLE